MKIVLLYIYGVKQQKRIERKLLSSDSFVVMIELNWSNERKASENFLIFTTKKLLKKGTLRRQQQHQEQSQRASQHTFLEKRLLKIAIIAFSGFDFFWLISSFFLLLFETIETAIKRRECQLLIFVVVVVVVKCDLANC